MSNDIDAALQWDTLVDDALVQVSVENGKVSLKETVGSAAEKTRAVNHPARTSRAGRLQLIIAFGLCLCYLVILSICCVHGKNYRLGREPSWKKYVL